MNIEREVKLEDLLLQRAELEIIELDHPRFLIPIHPQLLRADIHLDPNLATHVFAQAAQEWYNDLLAITNALEPSDTKRWYQEVFLKERPKIRKERGRQKTKILGWEDLTFQTDTGFTSGFSISRNAGGSFFLESDPSQNEVYPAPKLIRFTPEKLGLYAIDPSAQHPRVYTYQTHNIDYLPGALFLRNWAVLYLNAALRELYKDSNRQR